MCGHTLLVNLDLPVVEGKMSAKICREELSLVHTTSRLVHCTLRSSALDVGIIVAHAHHNGAEHSCKQSWLAMLKSVTLKVRHAGREAALLVDANTRLSVRHGRV